MKNVKMKPYSLFKSHGKVHSELSFSIDLGFKEVRLLEHLSVFSCYG